MPTARNEKYPERITLPVTTEMLEQIDSGLGEGEPRLNFIRDAIANEISRRNTLTYVKASFERANGKVFYMLSMVKGAEVIFSTSGYGDSEASVIISVLNYGLDFGVPAVVIIGMISDGAEHGRVYSLIDGRLEPMVDFQVGAPYHQDVLRAVSLSQSRG